MVLVTIESWPFWLFTGNFRDIGHETKIFMAIEGDNHMHIIILVKGRFTVLKTT